ncbi:uncharacterized protein LOC118185868 [Stegodyphus dumicola]|uniref:uncharacterized protein LOC118185868 n=1 Tax=Stegodyphus dumicola TaxID=202533 RepID=UPI0015A828E7|nr:uncharacterized protein LOC118185868 [Stegodyphus dumicola]
MVYWTYQRASAFLLITCYLVPQITAWFLYKDIALAIILGKLLKPRFVPLPIPIPFPFKVSKHTHKPYPVPIYSSSLSTQQVGHNPWQFPHTNFEHHKIIENSQLGSGHQNLIDTSHLVSGHHAVEQLQAASHNIENWVEQLSQSSDVIKASSSDEIPTIHDELDEIASAGDIGQDLDSSGEWW